MAYRKSSMPGWRDRRKRIQASASQRDQARPFRLLSDAADVTIKAAGRAGKLPTFEGIAYTGGPMCPAGWSTPVVIDLAGVIVASQHRPVLRQHDHEQIVGHTTAVTVHATDGIFVAGVFSGEQHQRDKVVVPAGNGFQWQLSVGAEPLRTEWLEPGEEVKVNGRTINGPAIISRQTEFGEVSFVPLGADGDTSATVTARAMAAMAGSAPEPVDPILSDVRQALAAELHRIRECTELYRLFAHRFRTDFVEDNDGGGGAIIRLDTLAIRDGWTVAALRERLDGVTRQFGMA